MSDDANEATDDAIVVEVSDFLDGLRSEAWRAEIAAKIDSDPAWKRVHADMVANREAANALSGLRKARAPESFAKDVTATIHKRSAGRFFGRRTFGDRVPFGALVIVALAGLAVIAYILWSSSTGSLRVEDKPQRAHASETVAPPPP
jgi:anti-sigma factor RsiW